MRASESWPCEQSVELSSSRVERSVFALTPDCGLVMVSFSELAAYCPWFGRISHYVTSERLNKHPSEE